MPYVGNMNTTFTTLTATDASITDDLTVTDDASFGGTVTVSGDNEKVQLGAGNDLQLYHDGSHSRIKNSTGYLILNSDTGILLKSEDDGTNYMVVTDAGIITMGLQPAFLVKLDGDQNDIAIGSASNIDVQFDNEIFDQNADFNTSTYTFTAPVTGRYQLSYKLRLQNVDSAHTIVSTWLTTSNRGYGNYQDMTGQDKDIDYFTPSISLLVDMDANDTAHVEVYIASGSAQTDISQNSEFSGFLAC